VVTNPDPLDRTSGRLVPRERPGSGVAVPTVLDTQRAGGRVSTGSAATGDRTQGGGRP
jgi:hypothetical protein